MKINLKNSVSILALSLSLGSHGILGMDQGMPELPPRKSVKVGHNSQSEGTESTPNDMKSFIDNYIPKTLDRGAFEELRTKSETILQVKKDLETFMYTCSRDPSAHGPFPDASTAAYAYWKSYNLLKDYSDQNPDFSKRLKFSELSLIDFVPDFTGEIMTGISATYCYWGLDESKNYASIKMPSIVFKLNEKDFARLNGLPTLEQQINLSEEDSGSEGSDERNSQSKISAPLTYKEKYVDLLNLYLPNQLPRCAFEGLSKYYPASKVKSNHHICMIPGSNNPDEQEKIKIIFDFKEQGNIPRSSTAASWYWMAQNGTKAGTDGYVFDELRLNKDSICDWREDGGLGKLIGFTASYSYWGIVDKEKETYGVCHTPDILFKLNHKDRNTLERLHVKENPLGFTDLPDNDRPIRVLSIDGGGIRGVGTAQLLEAHADVIYKYTGKSLHEFYDVIVGTSTGGILAVAAAMGISADEYVDIYLQNAEEIFPTTLKLGLTGAKHSPEGLIRVLKGSFQKQFGRFDLCLNEAKTHLGITAFRVADNKLHLFTNEDLEGRVNFHSAEDPTIPAGHIPAVKLAQATGAAPVYLEAVNFNDAEFEEAPYVAAMPYFTQFDIADSIISGDLIEDISLTSGKYNRLFSDGGLGANDPTDLGYFYASKLRAQGTFAAHRKIQTVSFGTGELAETAKLRNTEYNLNCGVIGFWMEDGFNRMEQCIKENPALLLKQLRYMAELKTYRHNFVIPYMYPLDITDPVALKNMVEAARKETKTESWAKMIHDVVPNSKPASQTEMLEFDGVFEEDSSGL